MSLNQEVVTVRNPAGEALHCILHMPAGGVGAERVGCLLLSPGVKMRVGPHRLHRKLAGAFLDHGIPVLRVDFAGLGDSEGEIDEGTLAALYRKVQLGRHLGEVIAAADWLERNLGVRRLIVGGLCGAAITAVLAAQYDSRVVAIYSIGLPVCLDDAQPARPAHVTAAEVKHQRRVYLRKFLHPMAWVRLLTLRSDFNLLRRVLLPTYPGSKARPVERYVAENALAPSGPVAPDLNPLFPPALFRVLQRNVRILLLFGSDDKHLWNYEEKFKLPWAEHLARFQHLLDEQVLEHTNHVIGTPASLAVARRASTEWAGRIVSGFQQHSPPGSQAD